MGDNIFFSIDIDIDLISWGVNFIYIDIDIDKSYLTCVSSYIYQFFAILPPPLSFFTMHFFAMPMHGECMRGCLLHGGNPPLGGRR